MSTLFVTNAIQKYKPVIYEQLSIFLGTFLEKYMPLQKISLPLKNLITFPMMLPGASLLMI